MLHYSTPLSYSPSPNHTLHEPKGTCVPQHHGLGPRYSEEYKERQAACVKLILEAGGRDDVDAHSDDKETPLFRAVMVNIGPIYLDSSVLTHPTTTHVNTFHLSTIRRLRSDSYLRPALSLRLSSISRFAPL